MERSVTREAPVEEVELTALEIRSSVPSRAVLILRTVFPPKARTALWTAVESAVMGKEITASPVTPGKVVLIEETAREIEITAQRLRTVRYDLVTTVV
jgi:hypothetical protein